RAGPAGGEDDPAPGQPEDGVLPDGVGKILGDPAGEEVRRLVPVQPGGDGEPTAPGPAVRIGAPPAVAVPAAVAADAAVAVATGAAVAVAVAGVRYRRPELGPHLERDRRVGVVVGEVRRGGQQVDRRAEV